MSTLLCHIASPTREHYLGEIHYASIPGADGYFGVLAGHQSTIGLIAAEGIVTVWLNEDGSSREEFLVMEGLIHIFNNTVKILGRFCKNVNAIDSDGLMGKISDLEAEIEEYRSREDTMGKIHFKTAQEHLAWYKCQLRYLDSH